MSSSTFYIITILTTLVILAIAFFPWFLALANAKKRVAHQVEADPTVVAVYRVFYKNQYLRGELYISPTQIWFEKAGTAQMRLAIKTIAQVECSTRSIQFEAEDGKKYLFHFLRIDPREDKFNDYRVFYFAKWHWRGLLDVFLEDMKGLGITAKQNVDLPKSVWLKSDVGFVVFSVIVVVVAACIVVFR